MNLINIKRFIKRYITRNELRKKLTSANVLSNEMQQKLRLLSLHDREKLAYKTRTMVVYFDQEVADLRKAEEDGAMRAAPPGYELNQLNGLNIGCGDRTINPHLLGCDAHSGKWEIAAEQIYEAKGVLLSWAHDLPFRSNSIDYVVALHVLEHVPDPVEVVFHWLDIVKPGGGVGVVVPDWRYTWDARNDSHVWSHRWNPTPELVKKLYIQHWSRVATLEHFHTYPWKLSFDFVLRKHGEFIPFDLKEGEKIPTGKLLFETGKFYHSDI